MIIIIANTITTTTTTTTIMIMVMIMTSIMIMIGIPVNDSHAKSLKKLLDENRGLRSQFPNLPKTPLIETGGRVDNCKSDITTTNSLFGFLLLFVRLSNITSFWDCSLGKPSNKKNGKNRGHCPPW